MPLPSPRTPLPSRSEHRVLEATVDDAIGCALPAEERVEPQVFAQHPDEFDDWDSSCEDRPDESHEQTLEARLRRSRRFVAGLSLSLAMFCVAVMGYRYGDTANEPMPQSGALSERAEDAGLSRGI